MGRIIKITIDLGQVCNDILTKSNLISKSILDKALADIRADVSTPDGDETRSIICRATTEALANVKYAAQRWMMKGRVEDNNNLERLVSSITYKKDTSGAATTEVESVTYEKVELDMNIPNFNIAVTDALKSNIHKYIVDYNMGRFLQDLVADKAKEYTTEALTSDYPNIVSCLNAREEVTRRMPSFI
jgi:hypothetical protein